MSRPTLQQLAYLVALVEHEGFGTAAAASHVSQPALSTQIRELERRLGVVVAERSTRGALITPAGRRAAARAREILRAVDDLAAELAPDDELCGPVAVGVIPTIAPYLLAPLVHALASRFPDAEPRLVERTTDHLVDALHAGELDLLLWSPTRPDGVESVALRADPFLLALPVGHRLARGRSPLRVDAVADAGPLLLLAEGHCLRDQALAVCGARGLRDDLVDASQTSLATLVQMVAAGVGVTLLPASAAAVEARPGSGVAVRALRPAPSRQIALSWRATAPRAGQYRELARLTRAALAGSAR